MRGNAAAVSLCMVLISVAPLWAQTPNKVPKYDSAGALVDSATVEVGGNVGIGAPYPVAPLTVVTPIDTDDLGARGLSIHSATTATSGQVIPLTFNGVAGTARARAGVGMVVGADWGKGSLAFYTRNASDGSALSTADERMRVTAVGDVGVGTAAPQTRLDVAGDVSLSAGTQVFVNDGTSVLQLGAGAGGLGSTAGGYANFWANGGLAPGRIQFHSGRTTGGAPIQFFTDTGSGPAEKMRLDGAGNLGLGITAPTAKLHVAGDVVVDGNLSAKFQDVAEWVPARERLAAGTVVVISDATNEVEASTRSYDTAVAGVISPQPGLTLGVAGPDKVLVAQSGRVRVRVDASFGAIAAGDLLVTSSVPGTAMRSQPIAVGGRTFHQPGTLLGKALESWTRGSGEILVLLTLQ